MTTITNDRLETLAKHGHDPDTRGIAAELLVARREVQQMAETMAAWSDDHSGVDPNHRVSDTRTFDKMPAEEVLDEVNESLRRCHWILTAVGVPFAQHGHEAALGTRLQMLKDKLVPRQHAVDASSWELVGFDDKRSAKIIADAHKALDALDVPRTVAGDMTGEYSLGGRLKLLERQETDRYNGRPRKIDWETFEEAVTERLRTMGMDTDRDFLVAETVAKHVVALMRARVEPAFDKLVKLRIGDEIAFDMTERPYYAPGDEQAPFFSEAFTYVLLGKEAARTLRAYLRQVAEAAGLNTDRW